ncbi:MAG: hypothetical protein LQ340_003431 [Diploschistes diacapsis]|nr:MAG: hypothetical protein LQ340_003431 [Diploschistes diacapsis]
MLSELDYSEYLLDASPSVLEVVKGLLDQGLWKYTSVLMAQPFDLAKVVLQVQDAGDVNDEEEESEKPRSNATSRTKPYDLPSDDSDDDSQSYFTSTAPRPNPSRRARRQYTSSRSTSPSTPRSRRGARSPQPQNQAYAKVPLSTSSITAVLSRLWREEGAWGVWKGTNSTFWHSVLFSTISSFLRSFLCAILALPDPAHATVASFPSPSSLARLDLFSSPSPLLSLLVSVSAAGIAGLALAPLDIARTKLLLTPSTNGPRSILPTIRSIGSWVLPLSIAPVTFLHSILPTLILASTPLVLRSRLGIDPLTTPTACTAVAFFSQAAELGIRLPIETVLRRGQMAIAKDTSPPSTPRSSRSASSSLQTTVKLGRYKGLFGTMYHIVNQEGSRKVSLSASSLARSTGAASTAKPQPTKGQRRKGQGLEGLWRGWRVGAWGLLGIWGAGLVGSGPGGGGSEF